MSKWFKRTGSRSETKQSQISRKVYVEARVLETSGKGLRWSSLKTTSTTDWSKPRTSSMWFDLPEHPDDIKGWIWCSWTPTLVQSPKKQIECPRTMLWRVICDSMTRRLRGLDYLPSGYSSKTLCLCHSRDEWIHLRPRIKIKQCWLK